MYQFRSEDEIEPVLCHANYYQARKEEGFGPRYIQEFQLLYVRKGRANVVLDNEGFEIQPGDVVFYGPGQCHQVTGSTDFELIGFVLLFAPDDKGKLMRDLPHSRREPYAYPLGAPSCPLPARPPSLVRAPHCREIPRFAEAAIDAFIDGNNLEAKGYFLLFVHHWLKAAQFANALRVLTEQQRRLLETAMADVKANLVTPPSTEALARKAALSPRHFNRLFQQYTGQTPRAFVERARMEEARRLLLSSSLTVDAVAQSVGYADPFYFSRRFRSQFGVPPSEIRLRSRLI